MKFSTSAVFSAVEQPLIDSLSKDGSSGGRDWSTAVRFKERGRLGRAFGYGCLEYDEFGDIITEPRAARASRSGRGGSWAMRGSLPLNFDGNNAAPQVPITYDISKCAGLQGASWWGQDVDPGSSGSVLNHHAIQGEFPGIAGAEAKALSNHIFTQCTSSGDFSELFYRLNVLGDDLLSGCTISAPAPASTYAAWLSANWPCTAGGYSPLLASFGRPERQYYLVGNRTNAYLTAGVIRGLAAVVRSGCGIATGVGGRNGYCRDNQFSDTLGLWIKGDRGPLYVDSSLGGNIVAPNINDVMCTIEWLRVVTGDDVGYSCACSAFTERLPFAELQHNCTGSAVGHRCATALSTYVTQRMDLMALMWVSWKNGADDPLLVQAHDAVFGSGSLVAGTAVYPAGRSTGLDCLSAAFLGSDNAEEWFALVTGTVEAGTFAALAPELTRAELALAAGACAPGRSMPLRLCGKNDVPVTRDRLPDWTLPADVDTCDLITMLGSPSQRALPAVGLRVRTQFAATNGLSVWHTTIDKPGEALAPATRVARGKLPPPREYYANLAIIGIYTRCLADEIESSCGRCEHLTTLMDGCEPTSPGDAPVWSYDQLEHSQNVFMGREYKSGKAQLATTRGARCLMWPALTSYVGKAESVSTCSALSGQWSMAVCFSALQREAVSGLPASVGGLFKNLQLFTHLYREQPDFVNNNVKDSDLSRANRLHVLTSYMSLHGQQVNMQYVVRYRESEYGEYDEYNIPLGVTRRVRCEGTSATSEVVSSLQWQRILSEQQIAFTGLVCQPSPELLTGEGRLRLVKADHWLPDDASPTEQDPGRLCVGLSFGQTPALLDKWRAKVALPSKLVVAGSTLKAVVNALAQGVSNGRRLLHSGTACVVRSWVCVKSEASSQSSDMTLMLNEAGANRAMAKLAEHAGLSADAVAVIPVMEADRKRVSEEHMKAESAPEPQSGASMQQLVRMIETLNARLDAVQGDAAVQGGAVDVQRPGATEKSVVSGITATTADSTASGYVSAASGPGPSG